MARRRIICRDIRPTIPRRADVRVKLLSGALVLIAATLVFAVAANELARTLRYVDLVYVNEKFEGRGKRANSIIHEYASVADKASVRGECRSDILDAAVGVVLADLDRLNPDTDYERWVESAARAQNVVEHAVRCAPFVSDYSLRLAMIKRAAGEEASQQATLMSRAVELDPASMRGLRSRFAQWRKLDAASLKAAEPALTRDLTTLLGYASPATVRELLKQPSPTLSSYIFSVTMHLPEERRQRLERWKVLPKT